MSTDVPHIPHLPSDAQLLYEYLGRQLDRGAVAPRGDQVLVELTEYQRQLDKLRAMVRAGEASLDAGEGRELDVDLLLRRVRDRIAAEGRAE